MLVWQEQQASVLEDMKAAGARAKPSSQETAMHIRKGTVLNSAPTPCSTQNKIVDVDLVEASSLESIFTGACTQHTKFLSMPCELH